MGEKAISGNIARSARLLRAILMMETPHPLWATCTSPEHLHQDSKKKKKDFLSHLIGFFGITDCTHSLLSTTIALLKRLWQHLLYCFLSVFFTGLCSFWAFSSHGLTTLVLSVSPHVKNGSASKSPLFLSAVLHPIYPHLSCAGEFRKGHKTPRVSYQDL